MSTPVIQDLMAEALAVSDELIKEIPEQYLREPLFRSLVLVLLGRAYVEGRTAVIDLVLRQLNSSHSDLKANGRSHAKG